VGKTCRPKRLAVTGDCNIMHKKQYMMYVLLYFSPNTVLLMRSRMMNAAQNADCISEKRNICRVFVGKFEETTWKSMA
jgi:hypothetical protein